MMTDWYQKSMDSLALSGKADRTQEAYSRALRMLCEFYGKTPEEIGETELETYFLHRRNVDRWSANTLRICYCGIRFYFTKILRRDWNLFNFLRAKNESRWVGSLEPGGGSHAAGWCPHAAQPRILKHRVRLRFAPARGAPPGGLRH